MDKEYKCPICGINIKKGNGHHIKKCIDSYVSCMTDEYKKQLYNLYYEEGYSMVEMSDVLGFKYNLTEKILKKIGINRRTLKEASNLERRTKKIEETNLKNSGCRHNFCKNSPYRRKWEEKMFEEEGIINVFQRKEVKEKIRDTLLKKYGKEGIYYNRSKGAYIEYYIEKYGEEEGIKKFNAVQKAKSDSSKRETYIEKYGEEKWEERLKKIIKGFKHNNGLNEKCASILKKQNITFEREFYLKDNKHSYFYDFKINSLLIELNGVYWHCSPKKYKENDIVKFPLGRTIIAKEKWEQDKVKMQVATKNGYDIVVIWEDEFSEEKLLNILKEHNYGNSKN